MGRAGIGLVVGVALIGTATWVAWRLDKGINPKWRDLPAADLLFVFIILGGWAGGIGIAVQSLVWLFSK